jgi:hypothetical protein
VRGIVPTAWQRLSPIQGLARGQFELDRGALEVVADRLAASHAGDGQIAPRLPREIVEIALIIRIEDLPRDALERTRCGNRALGYRIEQKPSEIGAGVFRENPPEVFL